MTAPKDPLARAFAAAELMEADFLDQCPACGKHAIYHAAEDRYFHTDGTSNRPCWVEVTRGGTR